VYEVRAGSLFTFNFIKTPPRIWKKMKGKYEKAELIKLMTYQPTLFCPRFPASFECIMLMVPKWKILLYERESFCPVRECDEHK
jgi:hypothetical protein